MAATTSFTSVTTNTVTSTPIRRGVEIKFFQVAYTSDATAGNRQISIEVYDAAANLLFNMPAGAVQAASLTYNYQYLQSSPRESTVVSNSLVVPIPTGLQLPANGYYKVYDTANVSAADTFDLTVQYILVDEE